MLWAYRSRRGRRAREVREREREEKKWGLVPSTSLSAIGGGLRKGLAGGRTSGAGSYGKETRRLLEDEDFFDERPQPSPATITGRRTASMASVELLSVTSAAQPPAPVPPTRANSSRRDPSHAPARSIADSASFYSQESAGVHLDAESAATLTPHPPPVPPLPHAF